MNNLIIHVIQIGQELLFEDDENEEKSVLEKVDNYAEETVPRFSDNQFKCHFRILPTTFEELLRKVHNVVHYNAKGRHELPIDKQLMITLWSLANKECFRSVADRFGISKSSCWHILYRTCHHLLDMNSQYSIISWPSEEKANNIMLNFENLCGIPGIIGAIDGCHIEILKPKEHPNSYINRKGYPSVLLQGVCDDQKLFIDVYAGEPGSVHDARVYRKSPLYNKLIHNELVFPNDSHLIGDLAYKLSTNLLVGYKDHGFLTNRQKNFNFHLSKARIVIENAFGYLKGRFRRLQMLETIRLDLISLLIIAGCILHNVCILNEDLPEDIFEDVMEDNLLDIDDANNDNIAAVAKRNNIANALPIDIRFR